jgi:alkylhydroperoxidase/carboxymuconolactone decarboxylase family protein YurZ
MSFECAQQFVKMMKTNPDLRDKVSKINNLESLKKVCDPEKFNFDQCDLTKAMAACMEEMGSSDCGCTEDQISITPQQKPKQKPEQTKEQHTSQKLDDATQILIAVGAATAANCIPCFEHMYCKAGSMKISDEKIQQAVDIASKVKTGASLAIKDSIKEFMNDEAQAKEQGCCVAEGQCC